MIRLRISQVSLQGRATQGVRLIQLGEGEKVVGIARFAANGDVDEPKAESTLPETSPPPEQEPPQAAPETPDDDDPAGEETPEETTSTEPED